jgi:hypothetical protein
VRNDEIHVELQRIERSLDNVLRRLEELPVVDMQGDIQTLDDALWRLRDIEYIEEEEHVELEDVTVPYAITMGTPK